MPFDGTGTVTTRHTASSLLLERAMLRIAKRKNWCRFANSRRGWFSGEKRYCMLGALHAESGDDYPALKALALTIDPDATDYARTIIQFNDGRLFKRSKHADVIRMMQTAVENLKTVNRGWSRFA